MSDFLSKHLHVTGLFPELLGIGGVQEAGRLVALALHEITCDRGWSYSLSGLNDPAGPQKLDVANTSMSLEGFARSKALFVLKAKRDARNVHKSGTHIVIAAHPNLAPIAVAMQKSRRTRAVVMAHGIEVWKPLPLIRRAALRRAFLVTGPSSDTIEKLAQVQKLPSARLRKVPWPLSPDFLRLANTAEPQLPPGFPGGLTVLMIGRAAISEKYKGTDTLIQAIAELRHVVPSLTLVAVGGGDDLPRLRRLVNHLGIGSSVHFMEGLSREQLAACYANSEIFAMPSAGEGFGLVFLEAMAFGKPIVAAACGGALDLVQHEQNGLLVPPQQPSALAAALRRLLEDEPLRRALGAEGAGLVRSKYSFDSFRANLEQLLEECATYSSKST